MADVSLHIHVHISDHATEGRTGTFTGPSPLVMVKVGDRVKWAINGNFNFTVKFLTFSPFDAQEISDEVFRPVTNPGNYHYSVSVTDNATGKKYVIANCPELGASN